MKERSRLRALPLLLAVLPALSGLPVHAGTAPPDAKATLRQAQIQFIKGDLKNACKGFLQASELSKGTSAPSWIGLSRCYTKLQQRDKALAMARKAHATAEAPYDRAEALAVLGELLLQQPDSRAEAARLYQDEVTGSGGARGRAGLLASLIALRRDAEARELMRSLRAGGMKEGELHSYLCETADLLLRTGVAQPDAINDRLRALDPDAPPLAGGKVTLAGAGKGETPELFGMTGDRPVESVVFSCVLDTHGRAQDCRAVQDPSARLTARSLESVRTWIIKPSTLDGAPVTACYMASVSFQFE